MKKIGAKLKDYFINTGVQKKWLADRIGMDHEYFYQIVAGRRAVPQQYWKQLISYTHGKIALIDLLEDCIKETEGIIVEPIEGTLECKISLKEINKTL